MTDLKESFVFLLVKMYTSYLISHYCFSESFLIIML